MQITGIPFANSNAARGVVSHSGLDLTTNYTSLAVGPISASGTTVWYLTENGDNVSQNDFPISGVSANDVITFTATYKT